MLSISVELFKENANSYPYIAAEKTTQNSVYLVRYSLVALLFGKKVGIFIPK